MADVKAARCPQYMAAIGATLGALALGTFLGWSSPAEPKADEYDFTITKDEFSWVGSILPLGAACVCIPIGIFINVIGRKWSMLVLTIPFIIAWACILFPVNLSMLIAGRFIGGVAGGAFCVAGPIYTAEIAQNEIRGILGFMFQLNITIGILLVYILGGIFKLFLFTLICAIIPIVFAIVFFFMPESPLFLLHKGKQDSAKKAMTFLRGKDYSADGELAEMQAAVAKDPIQLNPFTNIAAFKRRATIKGFLVCLGLMFFQQVSGINIVIFYSTSIFESASHGIDERVSTMIIGITQVIATLISSLIVDKVGRRILLILSDFIMALCTIGLGIFYYMDKHSPSSIEGMGWLTVILVCLFIIMFSFGFGPVPWLMVGELFAPDVKGICGSLCSTINWLLAFTITKTFSPMKDALGTPITFWVYSVLSLIGAVFVFFCVPETKGISLEEVQAKLEK